MIRGLLKIQGVGINDADYPTKISETIDDKYVVLWRCPYYERWTDILYRCYSEKALKIRPEYKDCYICEEWYSFMTFRAWMIEQDWEGKHLDKDFLVEGNKVYSPSTCLFLHPEVNTFISARGAGRGAYPIGVSYYRWKDKFLARCGNGRGKNIHLGYFVDPMDAHQAWKKKKLEICEGYIKKYKDEPLTVRGLTRIKHKLEYHIQNNLELTSF